MKKKRGYLTRYIFGEFYGFYDNIAKEFFNKLVDWILSRFMITDKFEGMQVFLREIIFKKLVPEFV